MREIICDGKLDAGEWIEVHRTAHRLGISSNCTMLYGHVERPEHRIDHLLRLRDLQDETGGFNAFIPLAFHPENNYMGLKYHTTGMDDLRHIAVRRLVLDNFPHIKAYWVMLTPKLAQVALRFGADDIDGTVVEEKIYHMAGAGTSQQLIARRARAHRARGGVRAGRARHAVQPDPRRPRGPPLLTH